MYKSFEKAMAQKEAESKVQNSYATVHKSVDEKLNHGLSRPRMKPIVVSRFQHSENGYIDQLVFNCTWSPDVWSQRLRKGQHAPLTAEGVFRLDPEEIEQRGLPYVGSVIWRQSGEPYPGPWYGLLASRGHLTLKEMKKCRGHENFETSARKWQDQHYRLAEMGSKYFPGTKFSRALMNNSYDVRSQMETYYARLRYMEETGATGYEAEFSASSRHTLADDCIYRLVVRMEVKTSPSVYIKEKTKKPAPVEDENVAADYYSDDEIATAEASVDETKRTSFD